MMFCWRISFLNHRAAQLSQLGLMDSFACGPGRILCARMMRTVLTILFQVITRTNDLGEEERSESDGDDRSRADDHTRTGEAV